MHPFLKARYDELEYIVIQTETHFRVLDNTQFNTKPHPKKWSIAECMQHLLLVYQRYRPCLQDIFEKKQYTTSQEPIVYHPSWVGKQFMRFVNPDKVYKIPAPPAFQPTKHSNYSTDLIDEFLGYVRELQDFIIRTEDAKINFNKAKIRTSITKWLKFTLGDYFWVESMHIRRHLKQMFNTLKIQTI